MLCCGLLGLLVVFLAYSKGDQRGYDGDLFRRSDVVVKDSTPHVETAFYPPASVPLQPRLSTSKTTNISESEIRIELGRDSEIARYVTWDISAVHREREDQLPIGVVNISSLDARFVDNSYPKNYTTDPWTWFSDPVIDLPRESGTVYLIAEGMDPNAWDNTDALWNGVEACRQVYWNTGQPCTLSVPRARQTYRFRDRTAVFANLQDFTLQGQSSTFLFARTQSYQPLLQMDTCTRCKFANFTVDWDWSVSPIASVVKVVSAWQRSWLISFPTPLGVPDLWKIHQWTSMHSLDQQYWSMGALGMIDGWFGVQDRIAAVYREGNNVRIDFNTDVWPIPQTDLYYLMRHWSYEVPGFWLARCAHCTFDHVRVISTPGKALVATDSSHSIRIRKSKFGPKSKPKPFVSDRFIGSAVDGLFFAKTFGRILIEDVEIGWGGDDCMNVHDPIGVGFRKTDWNTIVVGGAPLWRMSVEAGDSIMLRKSDYSPFGFEAKVNAAWQNNWDEWTVVLDRGLPGFEGVDTHKLLVVNLKWSASNVVIRNLWCHGELLVTSMFHS